MKMKIQNFSLSKTLECGQLFRYEKLEDNHYIVITYNKILEIKQNKDIIDFINLNENDYDYIINYFDLKTNYEEMQNNILEKEPRLKPCIDYGKGIKILNQDKLETIISFITSQNWKMTQTTKCLNNISKKVGKEIIYNNKKYYLFPELNSLKSLTIEDFNCCKAGLRDKFLYDAVDKIYSNKININSKNIYNELVKIKGIGPKVASCICLFGYHDFSIFPADVWIKKFMKENYNIENNIEEKSKEILGEYRGLAQQYIFNYIIHNDNINYIQMS